MRCPFLPFSILTLYLPLPSLSLSIFPSFSSSLSLSLSLSITPRSIVFVWYIILILRLRLYIAFRLTREQGGLMWVNLKDVSILKLVSGLSQAKSVIFHGIIHSYTFWWCFYSISSEVWTNQILGDRFEEQCRDLCLGTQTLPQVYGIQGTWHTFSFSFPFFFLSWGNDNIFFLLFLDVPHIGRQTFTGGLDCRRGSEVKSRVRVKQRLPRYRSRYVQCVWHLYTITREFVIHNTL